MAGTRTTDNPVVDSRRPSFEAEAEAEAEPEPEPEPGLGTAAVGGRITDNDPMYQTAVAAFARLGTAPTNWHQATIYFLTATDKQDLPMRRLAPLMYAGGLTMVVVQIITLYGMLLGMAVPPCVNNQQCENYHTGFYCYRNAGRAAGRCKPCGSYAPLIPYFAETRVPGIEGGLAAKQAWRIRDPSCLAGTLTDFDTCSPRQEINIILDQSYPKTAQSGTARSENPALFAGWNMSMITERCFDGPIQDFHYMTENIGTEDAPVIVVNEGGNLASLPAGVTPSRERERLFSARAVSNWCHACTHVAQESEWPPDELEDLGLAVFDNTTHIWVSVMNDRLQSLLAVNAMTHPDWVALFLCTYVVGMAVVGEIKDTALCTMSAQRHVEQLSTGWQVALELLNILRSQFFLQPLMGAIPAVVLTQGGSAMTICFNTIAVLFITDIDNMSFQFGLGERAKERVDEFGHITLTDVEATQLSITKPLCTVTCIVAGVWLVSNGALWAALQFGAVCAMVFKLSELLATWVSMTLNQRAFFVAKTIAAQMISVACFRYYYNCQSNLDC